MIKRTRWILPFLFAGLSLLFTVSPLRSDDLPDYDILIKGGRVYDGSLEPARRADIAIKKDKIVKVAETIDGTAERIIDANGLFVTPGFIDMHTHVQQQMFFPENRACLNDLFQGITSVVVGQCGESGWSIFEKAEDQIKRWTEEGIGPNAALLAGHCDIRDLVMGFENRQPTPEELEKMKALLREAMEQGASGMSTGLIYEPGSFADTEEVIELVKVIVPYGGIYHSHIRDEWDKHLQAVQEAIQIGEKSGAPVHISHFKIKGVSNWGNIHKSCEAIENARARGLKVSADQYPYRFSQTEPYIRLIPRDTWLGEESHKLLNMKDIEDIVGHLDKTRLIEIYEKTSPHALVSEGFRRYIENLSRERLINLVAYSLVDARNLHGPENLRERVMFLERMDDPAQAEQIRKEIRESFTGLMTPENIIIAVCIEKDLQGKSLQEAADVKGKSVEDTAIELELMNTMVIPFFMCEEDIEYAMKKEYMATGSDGIAPFYGVGLIHMRSYGTFLHKIEKYALERKTVSLAHVIRSQTSLAAEIMNWDERGWIREGYIADIVVLDMENIQIGSSIHNPHGYSRGVKYLLINGELTIDGGEYTGKLPGKILRPRVKPE